MAKYDIDSFKTVPELQKEYDDLNEKLSQTKKRLIEVGGTVKTRFIAENDKIAWKYFDEICGWAENWVYEISVNTELAIKELKKKIAFIEKQWRKNDE